MKPQIRTARWLAVSLALLAALVLGACSGVPAGLVRLAGASPVSAASNSSIKGAGSLVKVSAVSASNANTFEFTGMVQSIGSTAWVVSGLTIQVDASTQIESGLLVGDAVKVEGTLSNGAPLASQIKRLAGPAPMLSGGEFSGTVEAISGSTWTISGVTVSVDAATQIQGSPAVGDPVQVHVLLQTDGSLLASEIVKLGQSSPSDTPTPEVSPTSTEGVSPTPGEGTLTPTPEASPSPSPSPFHEHEHEFDLKGVVSAINGSVWTINGQSVSTDSNTVFKGSPAVGDFVEAEGSVQADGSLLAREISKEDHSEGQVGTPNPSSTPEGEHNDFHNSTSTPESGHEDHPSMTSTPDPSYTPGPQNTPLPGQSPEPGDDHGGSSGTGDHGGDSQSNGH